MAAVIQAIVVEAAQVALPEHELPGLSPALDRRESLARLTLRARWKDDRFRPRERKSTRGSLLGELLEFISTEVDELGTEDEIAHIEKIMREGTGADRQVAAWERKHNMHDVVDLIVQETYEGLQVEDAPAAAVG